MRTLKILPSNEMSQDKKAFWNTMVSLTILVVVFILLASECTGQYMFHDYQNTARIKYEYPQHNKYQHMWIPGAMVVSTVFLSNTMNVAPQHMDIIGVHESVGKARFTVIITGIALTTATVFVIDKFNRKHSYKRRK